MKMIGVSPAYFISRFSGNFSIGEIRTALPEISALGFSAVQPEIYRRKDLADWTPAAAAKLRSALADQGLQTPQFVAHYLGEEFSSAEALKRHDTGEMKRVAEIAASLDDCRVLTLPQPPFRPPQLSSSADYRELRLSLLEKMAAYVRIAEESGLTLALEILPHSLIGGSEGFLSLHTSLGRPRMGFNLDTGHARACKEELLTLPLKLGSLISGTHLCDNEGGESLSLKPGDGDIDWPGLLRALFLSGYAGSLDLEINCPADRTGEEYGAGREALERIIATVHGG
jgi:sugar phosphate isomerase/epimerase